MKKDDLKKRFNLSRRRTLELYKHDGAVSTYFAGLELEMIDVLAKCIKPRNPDRTYVVLSQLSFRQCVNAFRQTISTLYPKQDIITKVKELSKRLDDISSRRNEFVHSSWIAYSGGNYGQHRARSKNNSSPRRNVHSESPKKSMQQLINDIERLVFDLICFEDELRKEDSEQVGSPGAP